MGNAWQLDEEGLQKILAAPRTQETGFVCDADERDHLHVLRVGEKGSGRNGRGVLMAHEGGSYARVFMAAPRLRALAAALLNVADDLDGKHRLNFFGPDSPTAHDPHEEDDDT